MTILNEKDFDPDWTILFIAVGIIILLIVTGCGGSTPVVSQVVVKELHATNNETVECPEGFYSKQARLYFWMNGEPKSLEMTCEKKDNL